ncbi:MAG: RDD family protein [Pseudomonadota bacterium]
MGVPDPERDPQFYAGVPLRRFVAFLIDFVIVMFLLLCMAFVGGALSLGTIFLAGPLLMVMFGAVGFLYRWIMIAQRSATVGMMITGIEIRDREGDRMAQLTAFIHTAGFYVTYFFLPLLFIGWFLMLTSPHRRAMHDLILGSVVINRPA